MKLIFLYALVMAGVGLIESLLTLNVVDEITGTKWRSNKECIAQGTANVLNGFFTGMGGCAYRQFAKKLQLRHLSDDCMAKLTQAEGVIDVNIV